MRLTARPLPARTPAEPQRGEPVTLEKVGHHDVFRRRDQLNAGLVVVALDVFGIGGVEHQQRARRQPAMQALDLVERHVGAGRVVRIGEEYDLGPFRHRAENGVDIGGVVLLGRHHGLRARAQGRNRIDQKAVGGVDRLVAVGEIGARQQVEEVVGAGAAHDARGIEAEGAADRLAQFRRRAVGIVLEMAGDALIGLDRLRARPQRRLVGGQLVDPGDAGRAALAGNIGLDREHAGTRDRTLRLGFRHLGTWKALFHRAAIARSGPPGHRR